MLTCLINELRELEERATPGPWDAYHEQGICPFLATYKIIEGGFRQLTGSVDIRLMHELEFIAAARNELPRLLQVIEVMSHALENISKYGTWGDKPVISVEAKIEALEALKECEAICGKETG